MIKAEITEDRNIEMYHRLFALRMFRRYVQENVIG